jgi:hypothetical protein
MQTAILRGLSESERGGKVTCFAFDDSGSKALTKKMGGLAFAFVDGTLVGHLRLLSQLLVILYPAACVGLFGAGLEGMRGAWHRFV